MLRFIFIWLTFFSNFEFIFAQTHNKPPIKVIFSPTEFIAPFNNPFRVVAQQDHPVTVDQLAATFTSTNNITRQVKIEAGDNYFRVNCDSLGKLEISIKLKDEIVKRTFNVVPMPAIATLGSFVAGEDFTMGRGEFMAQRGLRARVDCCDYDAACEIDNYEIIRITKDGHVFKRKNIGGDFDNTTRIIISKTQTGDIYIFRNIFYKCPLETRPNRLHDFTLNIE